MDEDPVAELKIRDLRPELDNLSGRLMPEDDGRLFFDIPGHHVARADAARPRFDQRLARPDTGDGFFLKTDIVCGVQPGDSHADSIHLAMVSMSLGLSGSLRMTDASKPECMKQF